ncbi:hypothetical protein HKD42_11820 [Altererythrobacter sp. RZ02]|uniref:Tyr recombinase domain-containing protein n=1 Tax=Pontixanthobacter rizhaonensis TaxID=2730337 RepID=A0A848QPY1_9SPHN|nr:hypothetical protein [Pontixanthobacter rizhaonensis]NMW32750.1 hypothetical protein [Pontixanthobacter rizhaonensis]
MTYATRHQLEEAAKLYFRELCQEVDQPHEFLGDQSGAELGFQLEQSAAEILALDEQILANAFAKSEMPDALRQYVSGDVAPVDRVLALQLIARAKRQQLRYFIHQLNEPLRKFESDDVVFSDPPDLGQAAQQNDGLSPPSIYRPDLTLARARSLFVSYSGAVLGQSKNPIDEAERVLVWLGERVGDDKPVSSITRAEIRDFRNDLNRLQKQQGKRTSFAGRLNLPNGEQLHPATRSKYWRSVKAFFSWLQEEYDVPNAAVDLTLKTGKAVPSRVTKPLSLSEIDQLFSIPIFAGARGPNSLYQAGDYVRRRGEWWAGVLQLVYGMRGGECAQLLPSDFVFDSDIPHFKIQPGNLPEGWPKRHKKDLQVLALPIPPQLLELGLREFVEARQKKKRRLLYEIRIAEKKRGDGMSKLWLRHFQRFGLHSEGRGSHVFRHTQASHLRAAGSSEDEISIVQGRAINSISSKYGVTQQLERKLEIIQRLPYLESVVEKLGGPFDPKKH